MKITKRDLNKIIVNYLNEAPEDHDFVDLDDIPKNLDNKQIIKTIGDLWNDAKKNPGEFHLPVYAFLRYLAGDGSDLTEKEISKVKNGQKYLDELTRMLDIAAMPHSMNPNNDLTGNQEAVYEDGHKRNGFAMNYNGKDIAFYVIDYEVLLGKGGKGKIIPAWADAYNDKGKISDHLGVTIGQSGVGGKQIAQRGITDDVMLRPDLQNGEHRLVNEFDFTRLAPSEARQMTVGEVFNFYLSDLGSHLVKGPVATVTWLLGRTINSLLDIFTDVKPFKYDIILKSKISDWPDMEEYPFPKSAIDQIDSNEKVNTIKGQTSEPGFQNKRPKSDSYDDVSPGGFF